MEELKDKAINISEIKYQVVNFEIQVDELFQKMNNVLNKVMSHSDELKK